MLLHIHHPWTSGQTTLTCCLCHQMQPHSSIPWTGQANNQGVVAQLQHQEGMDSISESWKEGMENFWLKCVHGFHGFEPVKKICRDIVQLYHQAGFNEVDQEEV
ncbi:hypothetical protein Hamer_G020365 [Homarus americanus]|uniref:Uncharacterized protein n=1 Tax=Homarus americanus TaxID=6706 RepID=A0A8J5MNP2_HOMAM|nr:hypothetical protein Hamer_G020365 [Homarus americanus]